MCVCVVVVDVVVVVSHIQLIGCQPENEKGMCAALAGRSAVL